MKPESHHPSSEELFAYRDGELPADKRTLIEAHVTTCRACRALIDRVSGVEAALKQRPDSVEGDYYAALRRSVLRKIGAKERAEAEPAAARPETPARERRREHAAAEPRLSRAPRLPWAALLSTVSAAAAVAVVVVMLFRQGAVERQRIATAPREAAPREAAPRAGAPAESSVAGPAGGDLLAAREQEAEAKRSEALSPAPPPLAAPSEPAPGTARPTAPGTAAEQVALRSHAETAPEAGVGRAADEDRPTLTGAARMAPRGDALEKPGLGASAYGFLVRRFGLPDVWNEGAVSREALLDAEPDLRLLYVTGRAGSDSARVRLYLAEAARLRYESEPDSALYESTVHHYQRAIRLAEDQPDVERIARRRLETFSP